jgi:hypothetical protein
MQIDDHRGINSVAETHATSHKDITLEFREK